MAGSGDRTPEFLIYQLAKMLVEPWRGPETPPYDFTFHQVL